MQSSGRSAFHAQRRRRSTLLCAADKAPEESLKKTIEVDRLIDMLRDANPRELDQIVVENVLAFDAGFWVRLAARIDLCKSDDDKKDYEELAENVMNIVDRLVHKTDQKIEQSTDVLKAIISPAMHEGDVKWPPRDPDTLKLMEKEITRREQEGQLDEGFLSEVSAQLRQLSLYVFRLNKTEISQGFRLCCKRCCSYMLLNLSKNVVMHTKGGKL